MDASWHIFELPQLANGYTQKEIQIPTLPLTSSPSLMPNIIICHLLKYLNEKYFHTQFGRGVCCLVIINMETEWEAACLRSQGPDLLNMRTK